MKSGHFGQRGDGALVRVHETPFELLLDSVEDYGIFMLDVNGAVASWNTGAERIKGYKADEIIGRHFSTFYTTEDKRKNKPALELEMAARTGRFAEEGWRVRKNGTMFWANVAISAVRQVDGTLVGFAKVTRDLTERRRVEEAAAEANRLRDEILKTAPYAIFAVDPAGLVSAVNPAFERMLGYTAEETVGHISCVTILDQKDIEARATALSEESGESVRPGFEVLSHRPSRGLVEEREWMVDQKCGTRLPVSLSVSALRNNSGGITGYLGIAIDITERKRREEYTHHVAHHDALTGLPNRTLLADRLAMAIEQARRSSGNVGVLMLDLDHFKRINDTLGHHVGDELLVQAASRISACVRAADTVARMGGDEFVVVLGDIDSRDDAERIAAKIVECFGESVLVGDRRLKVTASVGVSCFPEDGDNANSLIKNADSAMYRAKAAGRDGYCTFNRDMPRLAQERLEMEHGIARALKDGLFKLHYQPLVSLDSGEITGMEALLRWDDPIHGVIMPDDFIPVAEECGLIIPLGEWVIRTACAEARQLQRRTGCALRLSINLSARQFRQDNLIKLIRSALSESGLSGTDIEFEITESTLMTDTRETQERLQEIHRLGATIAIDDFGIGFSSLSYLTRFPIDTLKIDRSFVGRLPGSANDIAVVQAVIALAKSLGIRIVAEGVETQLQLEFLRQRNCGFGMGAHLKDVAAEGFAAQGFWLGRAVSADAFVQAVHDSQMAGPFSALSVIH